MSEAIQELTKDSFSGFIANGPVLVDFWATWCGPCRSQGQILEKMAEDAAIASKIGKLNVDDERDLAVEYGVSSIPTLIVFKDGKEVKRFVGVQQPAAIKDALA